MALLPKWLYQDVVPCCVNLNELMGPYGEPIVAIVGEEVRNVIATGGPQLREMNRKHAGSQNAKVTKTQEQLQFIDRAADYLVNRRQCIESEYPDKATRKEFGLTTKLQRKSAKSVAHLMGIFLQAAAKSPEKVKKANIPADNIPKMEQMLRELEAGEDLQEGSKSSAKVTTTERNELQCKVESAMVKTVNAATIAYEERPEIVALFKDTLPRRRRGSRRNAAEVADQPSSDSKTEPESK